MFGIVNLVMYLLMPWFVPRQNGRVLFSSLLRRIVQSGGESSFVICIFVISKTFIKNIYDHDILIYTCIHYLYLSTVILTLQIFSTNEISEGVLLNLFGLGSPVGSPRSGLAVL